eukprot:8372333-Alexandrium_andersonii.AAC.1
MSAAVRRGYPALMLAMAMSMFVGPRALSQHSAVGRFVHISSSIVQGDMQSNNMAKAMLYGTLEFLARVHPGACPRQYVDDLNISSAGVAQQVVFDVTEATSDLVHLLSGVRLGLADKSFVVATRYPVAVRIASELSSRT